MLEWLIIGAGIHGCTTAAHLAYADPSLTSDKKLLLIDSEARPLSAWDRLTKRVGMKYLRSPGVHHLHPDARDLFRFSKRNDYDLTHFSGTSRKPSVLLFRDHCAKVLDEMNLTPCFEQASAFHIDRCAAGWRVETDRGLFFTRRVVIATGTKEHCQLPSWLPSEGDQHACHLHQKQELTTVAPPVTIVGGGMSGVQTALELGRRYPSRVTLAIRHPLRIWEYDSAPEWMGGKYKQLCRRTLTFSERRNVISRARRPGSITKNLYRQVRREQNLGHLEVKQEAVHSVTPGPENWLIHGRQTTWEARAVLCATGDQYHPSRSPLLARLIDSCRLPLTPCGYPALAPHSLAWTEGLYVSGPLADFAIGPTARNISGARTAASRIQQEARHVFL
ncbi:NAD(P)-binding domain-containing protein [Marinococcus sp. PL1-022]|uniref:NAD(P)-binding domain-containing protein n=1 Tax=Marinococcus sp. PL1-022 TaxID=3095363 RepID=UPI0029C4E02B|nr:NAD(P)-binding domain-containing protein [Marinococcus sp. PL1-022]MDX6152802.1 NAD(P)-binding domain-containing protein [Marinococcus sp. PL1-022]